VVLYCCLFSLAKATKVCYIDCDKITAPIAQLDRVPDYESVGRRFESSWAHQENQGLTAICGKSFFVAHYLQPTQPIMQVIELYAFIYRHRGGQAWIEDLDCRAARAMQRFPRTSLPPA
jgi:hypothetical protein